MPFIIVECAIALGLAFAFLPSTFAVLRFRLAFLKATGPGTVILWLGEGPPQPRDQIFSCLDYNFTPNHSILFSDPGNES